MKSIIHYKFLFVVGTIFFAGCLDISAQTNTLYYMGTAPQSYFLNPATQPECNIFIGIPLASQVYVRGNTNGISASDILFKDPLSDSLITPLHPNADINEFLGKLDEVESFGVEGGINLLSFGFRVKDMYFSFDASFRSTAQITYTRDFVGLLLKGNSNGQTFDLSKGGIDLVDYSEIGINISRRFGDKLQVGIRPKFLSGLGVISTISNNTTLETSTDEWLINADYKARVAFAGVTIPVDDEGLFDNEGEFEFDDSTLTSPSGYKKLLSDNRGLGIDIGAHYKPIDKLQVSLSVLDLGYINWKENTHVASFNGSFAVRGIDVTLPDSINATEDLLDSLKKNLNLTGSEEAFKTYLTPKILVGARYFITPGFDAGLLFRTDFYRTYTNYDLSLLTNWHPIPMISVSGSFSILNTSYSTFGLGIGLNLGPINFYTVLDDIPLRYDADKASGAIIPVAQTDYNIRFGLNFVFGCNKKKKLRSDKPMFNSSDWIL